jgi:hypothetical protein
MVEFVLGQFSFFLVSLVLLMSFISIDPVKEGMGEWRRG